MSTYFPIRGSTSYWRTYCFVPLSDTTIRSLKPGDTRKRLSDGGGLYLLPFVKGGRHGWRLAHIIEGRRKTISLNTYPATDLKLAWEKAAAARERVAAGITRAELESKPRPPSK